MARWGILSGKPIKLFIDPRHGGSDSGAVGAKSKEAENVLKVALALEKKLKAQGYEVKLSRRTDVYLTLKQRADLANAWELMYSYLYMTIAQSTRP